METITRDSLIMTVLVAVANTSTLNPQKLMKVSLVRVSLMATGKYNRTKIVSTKGGGSMERRREKEPCSTIRTSIKESGPTTLKWGRESIFLVMVRSTREDSATTKGKGKECIAGRMANNSRVGGGLIRLMERYNSVTASKLLNYNFWMGRLLSTDYFADHVWIRITLSII
jgi:hypothetical protein